MRHLLVRFITPLVSCGGERSSEHFGISSYLLFSSFQQVIGSVYLGVTVTGTAEGAGALRCGHLSST